MSLTKKLKFIDEQKKEYKKLRIVCGTVGSIGIFLTVIFYIFGYADYADLTISIVLVFLIIFVYRNYRKILSQSKTTIEYSNFQKEIYLKTFKLFILILPIEIVLAFYLMFFQTELLSKNLWLIFVIIFVPAIMLGIWAFIYEKKKFGVIYRAP